LTQVTFPITDNIKGRLRLDYFGRRGPAIGFDPIIDYGKDESSQARLRTFYIQDQNPNLNQTAVPRQGVPTGRYRLSLEDRTNFTDDIYGIANLTKLSDQYVMQDFYPGEFRIDPVPDNVVALTKTNPFFTLTGITRFQANEFFTTTERLPEVVLILSATDFSGDPSFMKGRPALRICSCNSLRAQVSRIMARLVSIAFHQLTYPKHILWMALDRAAGWLSRNLLWQDVGFGSTTFVPPSNPLEPDFILPPPTLANPVSSTETHSALFSTQVQKPRSRSRAHGKTCKAGRSVWMGLCTSFNRFTDFSYVKEDGPNPTSILGFDRYLPSTSRGPLTFRSSRPSTRSLIGRCGGWAFAIVWKPDATTEQ